MEPVKKLSAKPISGRQNCLSSCHPGRGDRMAGKPRIIHAVRDQVLLHVSSLDDLVQPDHLVREVWAWVESMDLEVLYDAVRSREGTAGAPCFDPRTLLCLWL